MSCLFHIQYKRKRFIHVFLATIWQVCCCAMFYYRHIFSLKHITARRNWGWATPLLIPRKSNEESRTLDIVNLLRRFLQDVKNSLQLHYFCILFHTHRQCIINWNNGPLHLKFIFPIRLYTSSWLSVEPHAESDPANLYSYANEKPAQRRLKMDQFDMSRVRHIGIW